MIANFSREELTIPKATVLGVAEEITEELVDQTNAEDTPKSDLVNDRQRKRRSKLLYRKLLLGKHDHIRGGKASDRTGANVIRTRIS